MTTEPNETEKFQEELFNAGFGCTLNEAKTLMAILAKSHIRRSAILPKGMTTLDLQRIDRVMNNDEGILMIPISELDTIVKHLLAILEGESS